MRGRHFCFKGVLLPCQRIHLLFVAGDGTSDSGGIGTALLAGQGADRPICRLVISAVILRLAIGSFTFAATLLQELPPIIFHIAIKGLHRTVADNPQLVSDGLNQMGIMADQNNRPLIVIQRMNKGLAALDIKMVGWLIQNQNMRRINGSHGHQKPRFLAA